MEISKKREKKLIREKMLDLRTELNVAEKKTMDDYLCAKIKDEIIERNIKVVHTFLPMVSEINLYPLINFMLNEGVVVLCPKVMPNRTLKSLELKSLKKVEKGVFGTTHPINTKEFKGLIDLIIVPGLAFDFDLYRVGYGGGYYDKFLNENNNSLKIGICYPFQLISKVPQEEFDIPVDKVITFHK